MVEKADTHRVETLKLARAVWDREADYRRDKNWQIFAWASSVLLVSIGGVATITVDESKTLPLYPHKLALIAAIIALTTYAIAWLGQNRQRQDLARENVHRIDIQLDLYKGIDLVQPNRQRERRLRFISYPVVVALISLVAIALILLA